jgi:uncharacterized protein (DUF433 family)
VPLSIEAEAPPLRVEESGAIRVGNTRVLLELVVRAFQDGATPEQIVRKYDTLTLADAYAVIGYYLRHRTDVEKYLADREREAEVSRMKVEGQQGDLSEIRQRIIGKRSE